jgi:hypothetical protein
MSLVDEDIREIRCLLESLERNTNFYPRWLDITQACKYASMSDKTLMSFVKSGDIYATKKRGKWIVDRESIDLFMLSDKIAAKETLARLKGIM